MAASASDEQLEGQLKSIEARETKLKAELKSLEAKKQSYLRVLLGRLKKRYLSRLLGAKAVKVLAPKASGVDTSTLGKITTIPKIASGG